MYEARLDQIDARLEVVHCQLFSVSLIAKLAVTIMLLHDTGRRDHFAALVVNRMAEYAHSLREKLAQDPIAIQGIILGFAPLIPTLEAMLGQQHPSMKALEAEIEYLRRMEDQKKAATCCEETNPIHHGEDILLRLDERNAAEIAFIKELMANSEAFSKRVSLSEERLQTLFPDASFADARKLFEEIVDQWNRRFPPTIEGGD